MSKPPTHPIPQTVEPDKHGNTAIESVVGDLSRAWWSRDFTEAAESGLRVGAGNDQDRAGSLVNDRAGDAPEQD